MIKIDINLVFTIINLLVLYLLMKKFLFGPIIKVMDVRKAMIDQQFAGAKEQEDQAKALKEQYEGALKSAREESFQIMEQARKEAKAQADKTVEDTQAKVSAMLAKAQEDINTERENAMRQMKDDVASLAMEAAGKIIGKNSGADQDLSLYDQFIEKAGDPEEKETINKIPIKTRTTCSFQKFYIPRQTGYIRVYDKDCTNQTNQQQFTTYISIK